MKLENLKKIKGITEWFYLISLVLVILWLLDIISFTFWATIQVFPFAVNYFINSEITKKEKKLYQDELNNVKDHICTEITELILNKTIDASRLDVSWEIEKRIYESQKFKDVLEREFLIDSIYKRVLSHNRIEESIKKKLFADFKTNLKQWTKSINF